MRLSSEDKNIIEKYRDSDLSQLPLLLQKESCDIPFIVNQIKGRKKIKHKVPTWFHNSEIIFPKYLSIEQSSSEWTAKRKAMLFKDGNVLDMTGGMGIDAFFISKKVTKYTLVEQQKTLVEINRYNFKQLNRNNIELIEGESLAYLQSINSKFDTIYLDPARRSEDQKKRVFLLEDFSPNIIEWQEFLWKYTDEIIIKLAPMIDLSSLVRKLNFVADIYVIAWKNEVKETILRLVKVKKSTTIHAINILNQDMEENHHSFDFTYKSEPKYTKLCSYIYEPNKAILKAGIQDHLTEQFSIYKMHHDTQFYTCDEYIEHYPGRIFRVERALPAKEKSFKKVFPYDKANIISRNHPLKASELQERFNLNSGGDKYILAFRGLKGKKIIVDVDRIK